MVTDQQYRRLLKLHQKEKSVEIAASKAGMTAKTARKYLKSGKSPSQSKTERTWRTRKDPFEKIWKEIEGLLEVDESLLATTIFDYLCRTHPGEIEEGQLRTLQRKVKKWKATKGPAKDVKFPQIHYPGVQCQSDYTCMNELNVTIANQPFKHLFYHFVLTYSNWEWGQICFSESLESLRHGLQNALWKVGGVPKEHRTDNLSAAVNNLNDTKEFNAKYKELLKHYGLKGSRNNPGKGHENGDVEQSHYRFKQVVNQELILRGSRNFETREGYAAFLQNILERRNRMRNKKLAEELQVMRDLPTRRLEDYTEEKVKVSRFSTISIRKNIYSVNSRLIGERVKVRLGPENLEVYYGGQKMEQLPRLRGEKNHKINYRHIIDSLVKKPGAFANYKYREDLFPRFMFRMAYDCMKERSGKTADADYVQLLWMAAKVSEEKVDQAIRVQLKAGKPIVVDHIKDIITSDLPSETILVAIPQVELSGYDDLLGEVKHG